MQANDIMVNKVAESSLITLDLEQYYPKEEIKIFDLKDFLFKGLIIKEKEFREALKNTNWLDYKNANVAVVCTADAIVPVWAYMLIASYLQPVANTIILGDKNKLEEMIILRNIASIDANEFKDKRVVIKGCGSLPLPDSAYLQITSILLPHVKSIMYGEPCSTVPVFKKRIV